MGSEFKLGSLRWTQFLGNENGLSECRGELGNGNGQRAGMPAESSAINISIGCWQHG